MQLVSRGAVTSIIGRTPTDRNTLPKRLSLPALSSKATGQTRFITWRSSQPAAGQHANGQPLNQDREHHAHVGRRQDHLPPGDAASCRLARQRQRQGDRDAAS